MSFAAEPGSAWVLEAISCFFSSNFPFKPFNMLDSRSLELCWYPNSYFYSWNLDMFLFSLGRPGICRPPVYLSGSSVILIWWEPAGDKTFRMLSPTLFLRRLLRFVIIYLVSIISSFSDLMKWFLRTRDKGKDDGPSVFYSSVAFFIAIPIWLPSLSCSLVSIAEGIGLAKLADWFPPAP